jgi:hypothetical protein
MYFVTSKRKSRNPRVTFLEEVAAGLPYPHVLLRNKHTLFWREGAWLNHVYVYSWYGDTEGAPRITRIAMNHYAMTCSQRTRWLLGLAPSSCPAMREELRLEFTVLDLQLAVFARWLPAVIAGRIDRTRAIPAPPVDSGLSGEVLRTERYAWTRRAWDASQAWHAAQKAKEEAQRARRRAFLAGSVSDTTPGTAPSNAVTAPAATTTAGASMNAVSGASEAV